MAGEDNAFEIKIIARAEIGAVDEASSKLRQVTSDTEAAAAATRELTEAQEEAGAISGHLPGESTSVDTGAVEAILADREAGRKAMQEEVAGEEEITDIQRQQQAIISSKLEAIELAADGRRQEAAALELEIEQMTVAVGLQKQLGVSEEEAMRLAASAQAARIEQEEREVMAEIEVNAEKLWRGRRKRRKGATALPRARPGSGCPWLC